MFPEKYYLMPHPHSEYVNRFISELELNILCTLSDDHYLSTDHYNLAMPRHIEPSVLDRWWQVWICDTPNFTNWYNRRIRGIKYAKYIMVKGKKDIEKRRIPFSGAFSGFVTKEEVDQLLRHPHHAYISDMCNDVVSCYNGDDDYTIYVGCKYDAKEEDIPKTKETCHGWI